VVRAFLAALRFDKGRPRPSLRSVQTVGLEHFLDIENSCIRHVFISLRVGAVPVALRHGREGSRTRARSLRLLTGAVDRRRRGFQLWGRACSSEAPAVLGRPGEACQLTRPRPSGAFGSILRHGSAIPVHERIRDHGVENRVDGFHAGRIEVCNQFSTLLSWFQSSSIGKRGSGCLRHSDPRCMRWRDTRPKSMDVSVKE
jgi:hypothetical protein